MQISHSINVLELEEWSYVACGTVDLSNGLNSYLMQPLYCDITMATCNMRDANFSHNTEAILFIIVYHSTLICTHTEIAAHRKRESSLSV